MYIESILIRDIPPISEAISLDCDKRVNLLIGSNASGKSTILRAMEYTSSRSKKNPLHQLLREMEFEDFGDEKEPDCRLTFGGSCLDREIRLADDYKTCSETIMCEVPILSIPANENRSTHDPSNWPSMATLAAVYQGREIPTGFYLRNRPRNFQWHRSYSSR